MTIDGRGEIRVPVIARRQRYRREGHRAHLDAAPVQLAEHVRDIVDLEDHDVGLDLGRVDGHALDLPEVLRQRGGVRVVDLSR